jgi:hypothetical protein
LFPPSFFFETHFGPPEREGCHFGNVPDCMARTFRL